jgi:ribonucleotide reductase beta subunit family protein with ferritin-like domain
MDEIPIIIVTEVNEETKEFTFEYGKDFINLFKQENPGKRATKANISKFIIEMFEKALTKEDGYDHKTIKI